MADYPVWDLLLPLREHGSADRRLVHARGHRLRFACGDDVLDATSGLWNVNLGYGNEAIANAISAALVDASYLTLFRYGHDYAAAAARALIAAAGPGSYSRVLFSTSGSAANDAAMKLARHYAILCDEPERRLVVGLRDSYHGQTFGAFSLTGEDLGQASYSVDTSLVRHVDHSDPQELSLLLAEYGSQVAAVVVEPVLGTGAHALSENMIDALLELRRRFGFLLVCDEVATGFGRVGTLFASQQWSESPDILVTSKGLTNGTCAAAALLVGHEICAAFEDASAVLVHGETQAGTPPSCAAVVATLEQFEQLGALDSGRRNAKRLEDGLRAIADRNELVSGVTGAGCFRGLHLRTRRGELFWSHHVSQVIRAIRARGALVHPGPSAIQLVPALTFSEAEITELLTAVEVGLSDFADARKSKERHR
jgi:adenosylmethionine-8-amino-7-oxononanoate aminotransferase